MVDLGRDRRLAVAEAHSKHQQGLTVISAEFARDGSEFDFPRLVFAVDSLDAG
jgi:hypothetical protein